MRLHGIKIPFHSKGENHQSEVTTYRIRDKSLSDIKHQKNK